MLEFKEKYPHLKIICVCSNLIGDKKIELIPLQFDDQITNYLD